MKNKGFQILVNYVFYDSIWVFKQTYTYKHEYCLFYNSYKLMWKKQGLNSIIILSC